ncbi:taste receptor type 2 member 40-like [Microcaecilia unicolor]|uniref:Taste receptor type 2 n=1 Tax=Microcaecilia unicolor TaxID=1415580 RepID=A0A6P7WQR6_9AMPH|nr:taste receptor type 2 member 40-like [Microcaecilia unicolor]
MASTDPQLITAAVALRNTTETSVTSLILDVLAPAVGAVLGILLNTFIVAVNAAGWVRRCPLNSCDLILACLGSVRALLQMLNLLPVVAYYCPACISSRRPVILSISVLQIFFSHSSFWFTAWLYIFYCARIANLRQPAFQRLKAHIQQWVPWLLLGSIPISFVCTVPTLWLLQQFDQACAGNVTPAGHSTCHVAEKEVAAPVILFFLSYLPPFLLCCAAAVIIVASLYRHTRRMALSAGSFRGPSLQAHFSAIKSVAVFCSLYAFYFLAVISYKLKTLLPLCAQTMLCPVILTGFPTVHALVLIFSNTKLHRAAAGFLLCKCKGERNLKGL